MKQDHANVGRERKVIKITDGQMRRAYGMVFGTSDFEKVAEMCKAPESASPPHEVIESPACPPGSAILMDVAQVNRHFAFVDGVLCKLEPHARPIRQPVDPTETISQE
jgi:hypothetical protein